MSGGVEQPLLGRAHPVWAAGAELGEGAIWDSRAARLWWVDIRGRRLHRMDGQLAAPNKLVNRRRGRAEQGSDPGDHRRQVQRRVVGRPVLGEAERPQGWAAQLRGADVLVDLLQPPLPSRIGAKAVAGIVRRREAFAEHAGFFWLDRGNAPERALALAQRNLAVRHTAKAYELGLLAATAAGKPAVACALGAGVAEVPNAPEMLRALAVEACGKR